MRLRGITVFSLLALLLLFGCAGQSSESQLPQSESADVASDTTGDAGQDGKVEEGNESGLAGESSALDQGKDDGKAMENQKLDPHKLSVGTKVTSEQIAQGGGEDAFFWSEEIPDEVFARMDGKSFGEDCTVPREDLRYIRVLHVDADKNTLVGELVVNRLVADEVVDIFRELYDARYPIHKMHLVDDYDAVDEDSCADDNTSAFNFRLIAGTNTISNHAYGLAIDINTYENPYYIESTGWIWPPEAERYLDRSLEEPYVLHVGDACYEAFVSRGWTWGGSWDNVHDYQHFEKPSVLEM